MYTLVVVDMQADFRAANGERVVKNCQREINQAVQDGAGIIFLEYSGYEATKKELYDLVDGYARAWTAIKYHDDGSEEAASLIRTHKLDKVNIKVCGVNTDCCVKSTVSGLTSRLPNPTINVIADACDSDWNHVHGLDVLMKMDNVSVKNLFPST